MRDPGSTPRNRLHPIERAALPRNGVKPTRNREALQEPSEGARPCWQASGTPDLF